MSSGVAHVADQTRVIAGASWKLTWNMANNALQRPPESDKKNPNASFVVYCKHNFWVQDNTAGVSMTRQHFDFPAFEVTANPSLLTG